MVFDLEKTVKEVLSGDIDAFAAIVREYQNEIWAITACLLQNRNEAEDFVQQIFIQAYKHLDRYEPGRDFSKLIKGIARNVVKQDLRRRAREGMRLKMYEDLLTTRMENAETAATHEEHMKDALRACRKGLSESAEKILSLRYVQALGFQEIAGQVGRTIEATRQMLSRIRAALRECIEKRLADA